MKITKGQIITIIVAVLLVPLVAHYDDFLPYRWRTFRAADGSFSVRFPGKVTMDERSVQLVIGGTTALHEVTAQPTNHTVYSCSYGTDPRLVTSAVQDVLNEARDAAVANVQGIAVSDRDLEVGGYPAKDIEVRARGDSVMDMRLIAVGRRMFALTVIDTDGGQPDSKNTYKFFNSIRFSK